MTVDLISNVRAITPTGVVDDATVAIEEGRVVSIEGRRSYAGAVDGGGALCLPGLVDCHCDAIEKEVSPRPTVRFDLDFALSSLEARFLSAGITTVHHGVSFGDDGLSLRSVTLATDLVEVIARRRRVFPRLDHRVLFRAPVRAEGSVNHAVASLRRRDLGTGPRLLSVEDHTPGQGQFRDLAIYEAAIRPLHGDNAPAEVARRVAAGRSFEPVRVTNLATVERLASSGTAKIVAHDLVDADEIERSRGWGASIAEFPVSIDAARRARELDMPVVLGAPNVLLGGSHSGNVSAEAVIAAGFCTALASDYLPTSLLAAAFDLAERNVVPLHRAVALVTSGPARAAGLPDRALEVGATADLVLVAVKGRWPSVSAILPHTASAGANGVVYNPGPAGLHGALAQAPVVHG